MHKVWTGTAAAVFLPKFHKPAHLYSTIFCKTKLYKTIVSVKKIKIQNIH